MAVVDRFKDALTVGKITTEDGKSLSLTAQLKYDYLSAVHSMDQLTEIGEAIKERKQHRDELREKLSNSCKVSLKKFVEDDEVLTLKKLDLAIKGLQECRNEIFKLDCAQHESDKLAKYIVDGVSAGR